MSLVLLASARSPPEALRCCRCWLLLWPLLCAARQLSAGCFGASFTAAAASDMQIFLEIYFAESLCLVTMTENNSVFLTLDLCGKRIFEIPVELRSLIKDYLYKPINDSNIRSALNDVWVLKKPQSILNYGNMNYWDTSKVVDMSELFGVRVESAPDYHSPDSTITDIIVADYVFFNESLLAWDVSNVKTMRLMFYRCQLFNQPLHTWDVSNVEDMTGLFQECPVFNQPLDMWQVSNVTTMHGMFYGTKRFNQPLNNWNVSKVVNMTQMFGSAESFNQPLDQWQVSHVIGMGCMFYKASKFNQPLIMWDLDNAKDIMYMFIDANAMDKSNLPKRLQY